MPTPRRTTTCRCCCPHSPTPPTEGADSMGVKLAHNQYGKAETRVVRVYRDADPHELVDYSVSVALAGEFADVYLTGDNANCLTTDATKNTVYAFAREHGEQARQPESFGLALARHFVEDVEPIRRAGGSRVMDTWGQTQTCRAPYH